MIARIRKNDTVFVLSGRDKGKQGEVIEVLPKKGKVLIKGIGLVTKHYKARKQGEASGIKKIESYLLISRVMPVCSSCKQPCRISFKVLDSGKRARACNRCQKTL
jgi:large subunit ribosomal protein L24